ncbi:MAG: hypothetical protein CHACPFDD_01098 [Phycisphaerae bacterium]|nr:hypothetical protein [Phycisphaerae bacterium]
MIGPTVTRLLEQHPVRSGVVLSFAGFDIRVESNSDELTAQLASYYRQFVTGPSPAAARVVAIDTVPVDLGLTFRENPPDPRKQRVKEEYADFPDGRVVRKRLTGMLFAFGACGFLAIGECRTYVNQVVNFINNVFMQAMLRRRYLLAHAAAAARDGRCVAVAGVSGAGKSTLVLHLVGRGNAFVSNDRVLLRRVDRRIDLLGVPKLPRVNPGTILSDSALQSMISPEQRDRLLRLPPDELWRLEQKYDVDIDARYGVGQFVLCGELVAIFILNWRRDGGVTTLRPVQLSERRELFEVFRKLPGVFCPTVGDAESGLPAYLQNIGDCPVYELSGGVDFERAADACEASLSGAAVAAQTE